MNLTFNLSTFDMRLSKLMPLLNLNLLSPNVLLCGGALQVLFDPKAKVNDFDLYFVIPNQVIGKTIFQYAPEKFDLDLLVKQTRDKLTNLNFKCVFECPEGKLYSYKKDKIKIQLIVEQVGNKIYSCPFEVIDDFDLSCCCIATDGSQVFTLSKAVRDIRRRRLSIHKLLHPVSTLNRIGKYRYKKGYSYAAVREEFLIHLGIDPNAWDMRRYVD